MTQVDLFSWTEPFLCPNLHEYIAVVNDAGLPCGVSSTLSLRNIKAFDEAICRLDVLWISVSGLEQEIYQVNHVGGNIEYVKRNLERIAELKRSGAARVNATLRLLLFDYNRDEEPKLRAYRREPRHRVRGPRRFGPSHQDAAVERRRSRYGPPIAVVSLDASARTVGTVCPLLFEHITVNADGDVHQCCAYGNYDVLKIGPYLELTPEEILLRRYTHPICNSCSWPRRPVRPVERVMLQQAMGARLGVPDRSGPI